MKTVSGKIISTKPVNLSKAAIILSNFVKSDNGASQPVAAYLRRASAAFNELVYFKKHHRLEKNKSKKEALSNSDASHRSLEEEEVENDRVNKKSEHNRVEVDENRTREVEGKLGKKEKKRKKAEGSLGSGEIDNIEVNVTEGNETMKEKNEERKKKKKRKNAEVDGGESGNSGKSERKKRRTEADD